MKRFFPFISLLLCFLFTGTLNALSTSAESCILMTDTGCVLYEKEADVKRGMASTTKIMTAVLAIEQGNLDRIVEISPKAVGIEGSSVYLCAGEKLTMRQLLYALMLQSANDAAVAIAVEVSGSVSLFVDKMNEKAASLGLSHTHFDNPHGLDGETHYTSARDLAMLTKYALSSPTFCEIAATKRYTFANENGTRLLINHNRLLRTYDDIIGVKTGYTKKCGRTLVSAACRNGVRLICVTLCDGDDWHDHRRLLDYGFSQCENTVLAQAGEVQRRLPVCGGVQSSVAVKNKDEVTAVLPKNHDAVTMQVFLPPFLYAGTEEGACVGYAVWYCGKEKIASAELVAESAVPLSPKQSFLHRIFTKTEHIS